MLSVVLSCVQQRVRELVQEAQNNQDSYLGLLDRLLQEEVTAKEERRTTMSLRIAGLPFAKTIEEYDFAFHDSVDKRQVMSLFDLDYIGRKENVSFLGPPGVGKTHLATALAIKACYWGVSICFTTMANLIAKLKRDADSFPRGETMPEAPSW